jgi:methyl-accepting chemotaxis protein
MTTKGTGGRYKRRHYLIDAKFQMPIAAVMAVAGLAMIAYHLAIVRFIVAATRAGKMIENYNLIYVAPLTIVLLLAVIFLAVLVSHRVVGPAYRLKHTIDAFADGELEVRANLRKADALKDVATSVNTLGDTLKASREARATLLAELEAVVAADDAARDIVARLSALDGVEGAESDEATEEPESAEESESAD